MFIYLPRKKLEKLFYKYYMKHAALWHNIELPPKIKQRLLSVYKSKYLLIDELSKLKDVRIGEKRQAQLLEKYKNNKTKYKLLIKLFNKYGNK